MELTSAEAHELSGAYVLDALGDDERAAFEQHLARDPDLLTLVGELLEAASLLGATEADAPPADLAARTFATAFARRPPGTAGSISGPIAAYRGQMDELTALLGTLAPADWAAPTVTGFTVHGLVAHLLAIEAYVATRLGVDPPPPQDAFVAPEGTEHDHRAMTEPTVAAHAGDDPADTVAEWRRLVDANLAHLATLGEKGLTARVSLHGLDLSVQSMIGTRIFEVWTHTDDIRRAIGRAVEAPATDRLRLMSNIAVRALPLGLLLAGIDDSGRTVRMVLTGAGGGEWLQPLTVGAEPGEPDAIFVADVVDFCRLAAQRLGPDEITHRVEGDHGVGRAVLIGAQVFAA